MFDTDEPITFTLTGGTDTSNYEELVLNYYGVEPVVKNVKSFITRHSFELLSKISESDDAFLRLNVQFKDNGEWFAFSLQHPSELFAESVINPLASTFETTYRDLNERMLK